MSRYNQGWRDQPHRNPSYFGLPGADALSIRRLLARICCWVRRLTR